MTEEPSKEMPREPKPECEGSKAGKEESCSSEKGSELAQVQASLKECQEKYVRLLAESENARKRLIKERNEHEQFAVDRVIVEFLQPLDNFEKALKFAENVSPEVKSWAIGFEMILMQFKQILTLHGFSEFDSLGKHFDAHLHEAVEIIETQDYESGTILQEFVRGYKKGERIVRVASVKVSKKPSSPSLDEKNDNKNN